MDFIERFFGVSPDGGDGSLEFVYAVSVVAAIVFVSYVLQRRGSRRDSDAGGK
jgi:hypothetical protein